MKLDAQEICDLAKETETKRSDWARAATIWETAWKLCAYDDSHENNWELDGVRTYTSPDPFNIILMLQRLIAHEMRIEVPYISKKDNDAGRSNLIAEWLTTFDVLSNRQFGVNHANDMTWQSGVLGRGASQILWIGDVIPHGIGTRSPLPVWRRTLDPRNVGVSRGPYWTDYGFHKYEASRAEIMQRYPKYELPEPSSGSHVRDLLNERYNIIDFWSLHKGAIWHSVVVESGAKKALKNDYAIAPTQTDYPDIPIIEWFADGAPIHDELWRSLGILHPIIEPWKAKNHTMSKFMTGLDYHFDPAVVFKGLINEKQALEFGPGARISIGKEESIEAFRAEPNVPMAQAFLSAVQVGIDQATFPGVAFGDAPGGVQAGFALNNLTQQSQSRPNVIRQNIEAAMETENQHILAQIEAMADEEGVTIFRRSTNSTRGEPLTLSKKVIKGNYDNEVRLIPEKPQDDTQKLLALSGLADKRLISDAYFRDEGMNQQMPRNEEARIAIEDALKSPEMALKKQLRALQDAFDMDDVEVMIHGTPLEQVWESEKQFIQARTARREAEKEQRKQEKEAKEQAEMMANMPPMMPPGPMPPDANSLSFPPPSGSMSGNGGMSMIGGALLQPSAMQPPGMPGLPPQMAGQMTPDMLGLPPGGPPGQFDQLMGGAPPSEEELLRQLTGGMPPQM